MTCAQCSALMTCAQCSVLMTCAQCSVLMTCAQCSVLMTCAQCSALMTCAQCSVLMTCAQCSVLMTCAQCVQTPIVWCMLNMYGGVGMVIMCTGPCQYAAYGARRTMGTVVRARPGNGEHAAEKRELKSVTHRHTLIYRYRLALPSPLPGLSFWKLGLGELVTPVPVTCARHVQTQNIPCT